MPDVVKAVLQLMTKLRYAFVILAFFSVASCSQQPEETPPQPLLSSTKVAVFILWGGLFSTDGYITSAGMGTLANEAAKLPGVEVKTYLWGSWQTTYRDLMAAQHLKTVVIGYSGGGHKATWIANGWMIEPKEALGLARPRIDLMVLYDPSPSWSMMAVGPNVKLAISYHDTMPLMFGLGGGRLVGRDNANVFEEDIAMQHLAVQYSSRLHARTIMFIKQLLE